MDSEEATLYTTNSPTYEQASRRCLIISEMHVFCDYGEECEIQRDEPAKGKESGPRKVETERWMLKQQIIPYYSQKQSVYLTTSLNKGGGPVDSLRLIESSRVDVW
jgi:hypothetical protein